MFYNNENENYFNENERSARRDASHLKNENDNENENFFALG